MNTENFSQFFSKKAYEISYAAFRISSVIKIQSFVDRFFEQSCLLLDFAVRGRYLECKSVADSMGYLLRLGGDIGIIHPQNVQTMVQEIEQLNSAIAEYGKLIKQAEFLDLDGSFSKMAAYAPDKNSKKENPQNITNTVLPEVIKEEQKGLVYESDFQQKESNQSNPKSAIRQSAILEIIRQSSNLPDRQTGCRLKEIQDSFGDVSERTIRYDLQDLIERGFIERIGNGGPATYYKVLQVSENRQVIRQA